MTILDELVGPDAATRERAERVGRRFLRYLELLQPVAAGQGPEIEIEIELSRSSRRAEMASDAEPEPERRRRGDAAGRC